MAEKFDFEKALARLDEIVKSVESGTKNLEENMKLYGGETING